MLRFFIILVKNWANLSSVGDRRVKVSLSPWANSIHHGFELGWVEKLKSLPTMGKNVFNFLKPQIMWVQAGLKWANPPPHLYFKKTN